MKGQSYIVEYVIMFGISFALFSTIGFIFYSQTQHISNSIGEYTSKLINDVVIADSMKSFYCKACDNLTIKEGIPTKIGDLYYNVSLFTRNGVNNELKTNKLIINTPIFNLNETFQLSGNVSSNNKKMEIKINNKDKKISVS